MIHAKSQLGADEHAVAWYRRGIDANRNFAGGHFFLAAALALLGQLDEARAAVQAELALDHTFTISRYRAGLSTNNPTYPVGRERIYDGTRHKKVHKPADKRQRATARVH